MRKLLVDEWMALDRVVQAPGAPDEDTTGGFQHGGWHLRYFDDISRNWVLTFLNEAGGSLRAPHPRGICRPLARCVRGKARECATAEHQARGRCGTDGDRGPD